MWQPKAGLFVTSNKFTKEEIEAYDVLKTIIFDEIIGSYVTIVRTNFPNFMKEGKIVKDLQAVGMENHITNGVIYVDNPPLDIFEIDTKHISNKKIIEVMVGEDKEKEGQK